MLVVTNIVREKDDYTFILNNSKQAKFNFISKIKIGVSGKQVKKLDYMGSLLSALTSYNCSDTRREVCDRLISLPIDFKRKEYIISNCYGEYDYQYALDNWKKFVKYARSSEEKSFNEWCATEEIRALFPKVQCTEFWEIITRNLIGYNYYFPLIKKYKLLRKKLLDIDKKMLDMKNNRAILLNGETEKEICEKYGINFGDMHYMFSGEVSTLFHKFQEIDVYTKKLGLTDYVVTDIEQSIRDLTSALNEKDNEQFSKFQSSGNLDYENEHYEIIVPKSREDLANYGQFFHNCLNGWEWDNFLSRHRRYVAIVYNKKAKKPVVCMDIEVSTRKIQQYLGVCNASIGNTQLRNFRKEYQDFLSEKGK